MSFYLSLVDDLKPDEIYKIQKFGELDDVKLFESTIIDSFLPKDEKMALVKIRWNQGLWRKQLLNRYKNSCPLTNIYNNDLLIASHIKPYHACDRREAIDINNGIILNALLDKLFDKGLVTFDDTGKIIFSKQLIESDLNKVKDHLETSKLDLYNSQMNHYMNYHRKNIFK